MRSHKKRTRACAFVRNRRLLTTHTHCVVCCASEHDRDQKMILNRKQRKKNWTCGRHNRKIWRLKLHFSPNMVERSLPAVFLSGQCQRCDCCVNIAISTWHQEFFVTFLAQLCPILNVFCPRKSTRSDQLVEWWKKKTVLKYLFVGRHCLHYSNALFNIH